MTSFDSLACPLPGDLRYAAGAMSKAPPLLVLLSFVAFTPACKKKESPTEAPKPTLATPPTAPGSQPNEGASSQPKPRLEPNFENPTDTTGLKAKGTCDDTKPCTCVGVLEYGDTALDKIGITPAHLTEGTACVFGDFDGNGYLDAAFLGVGYGEVVENKPQRTGGQVLMFDGVGLRLVASLPAPVLSLARRAKVKVGDKTRDALYDPEGDQTVEFVLSGERMGVRKVSGQ